MRNLRKASVLILALFSLVCSSIVPVSAFASDKGTAVASIQTVNINTATAEQLASGLKGVGMKKAQAIVEYRKKVGKFVKVEQLAEVKGIGAATIEKNRAAIKLK